MLLPTLKTLLTVAKVLTLDIETSPAIVYAWGLFDQNVGLSQIITPSRVLCFAAKWQGEKKVHFFSEWDDGDHGMVHAMHSLLDTADVVVSYNGKSFDIPHMNREMVEWGLTPPAPYGHVDLYQTVRRQFKFLSGKLDYVSDRLLDNKKLSTDFGLWKGVLAGDRQAQRKMAKYNKHDVVLTEQLYELILPWIPNHPSVALIDGKAHACPSCGSGDVQKRGVSRTRVSTYQRYQCQACGAWSRAGARKTKTELR